MALEEMHDIVIVGGGIGGLALSLALHRKGIKSLVLERSEVLRSDGAAMTVHGNGWNALDQLMLGDDLRNCSMILTGMHYEYLSNDDKFHKRYRTEMRVLRRKDLIETLARDVPAKQLRFGCHVTSVEFDEKTNLHVLTTRGGGIIKAKVLIGCDGTYSTIAKSLRLALPQFFPIWMTRGLTTYPEGHSYGNHFLHLATTKGVFGRLPIDDKTVHFWLAHSEAPTGDINDPEFVRSFTMELLQEAPSEVIDTVKNTDMDTLNLRQTGYRSPWALLLQNFRKGTMTVAGDAMHTMGPFLGQGGCSALEDAVVLTRCLSKAINAPGFSFSDKTWVESVEDAIDLYIKERRPRIMSLAIESYLVGAHVSTKSWLKKWFFNFLLKVFFGGNNFKHTLFDCGTI